MKSVYFRVATRPVSSQRLKDKTKQNKTGLCNRLGVERVWQNNLFEDQQTILAMDRSEVERFANKQLRKQMCLFNTSGRALTLKNCFDAIRDTQTLILVPDDQLDISRQLIAST